MLRSLLISLFFLGSLTGLAQRVRMSGDTSITIRSQLVVGETSFAYGSDGLYVLTKTGPVLPFTLPIGRIPGLSSTLNSLQSAVDSKASSAQITQTNNSLTALQGLVATKADANTVAQALTQKAAASDLTATNSVLASLSGAVATKADAVTTAAALIQKAAQTDLTTANSTISANNLYALLALSNRTIHATLSQIRSYSGTAPKAFYLIDRDKGGMLPRDSLDASSPDDGAVTFRDGLSRIYKRKWDGYANLIWWNPKGDNSADDSLAVQSAVNYVLKAASTAGGELPKFTGNPGTLICPVATYRVANIRFSGSVRMIGQGGGTYGMPTFVQSREGVNIFVIKGDASGDGVSNSSHFENIAFKSGSGTRNVNVAQIKVEVGLQSHSLTLKSCWGKSPENLFVDLPQGDDFQMTDCKVDVAPWDGIRLGSATGRVTNAKISGTTFYRVYGSAVRLINVVGANFTNNTFYTNDDHSFDVPQGICFDGVGATAISGVTISSSEVNNVPNFIQLPTLARNVTISGITAQNANGTFFNLFGGGIMYGLALTSSTVSTSAGVGFATAPITGEGCGLQGSTISGVNLIANATVAKGINLPDSRVFANQLRGNTFLNITTPYTLANLGQNGQLIPDFIPGLATGDLLYYNGSNFIRIGIGSNGQYLRVVSGVPAWSN